MIAILSMTLVIGCAQVGGDDLVTESDESPGRKRARIRLELASGYFQQGQANVALDEVKQAIAIDPTFSDAFNLRGLVYMRLNDLALADESFRKALALNPRDSDAAHNYGWLLCQQTRYDESTKYFMQAIGSPGYSSAGRTWMSLGLCQIQAGQPMQAEKSLSTSHALDPGNPVAAYNLAKLMFDRDDLPGAQLHSRRLNSGPLANAETLWLGIKIERKLNNRLVMAQLAEQLRTRFGQSREFSAYDRGAFNE